MELEARARQIRLLCTDIDGVLTNGELHYGEPQWHGKSFHVRDGAAIKWLQKCDIVVAFISGLDSPATRQRAKHLGVEDCYAGSLAKGPILAELCAKYGLEPSQVAHLGDDLPDLPLLRRVGLACCPRDSAPEVIQNCHWVVPVDGGRGVLRAVAELILKAKGQWQGVVDGYLD